MKPDMEVTLEGQHEKGSWQLHGGMAPAFGSQTGLAAKGRWSGWQAVSVCSSVMWPVEKKTGLSLQRKPSAFLEKDHRGACN